MAHYAIVCSDDAGGFVPICTVGHELVRRGHRVTVVAREKSAPLAKLVGLPLYKLETDDVPRPSAHLQWLAFSAFGAGWMCGVRQWLQWHTEAILRKLPKALTELAVDGVVIHQNMMAGGTAADRAGVPFVTVCSSLLWHEEVGVPPAFTSWPYAEGHVARLRNRLGYVAWHWYMGPMMRIINRYRRAWGLPRFRQVDDVFSPLAQISQLCAEFDFPRRELPPHFHYIGSLGADRKINTDHQFPWDKLNEKPLVFASLGTVADRQNPPVFRTILAACAGLDVQLVLALGKWENTDDSVREKLGKIPDNALVVDFAPQMALLDRAALLVTHAGSNTVLESLCRGVPMVALPRSADQTGMASRVVHTGTGLRASFKHCTPQELRGLVERVLAEDVFRRRAGEMRHAMSAAGGSRRAAEIAEEALTTRRPVRH